MELTWPCRLVTVGGSSSGKTYLVRKLILCRALAACKKELDIVVASPVSASLSQGIWKDLRARGYKIRGILLDRDNVPAISSLQPGAGRRLLLVVDDIDHVREIRGGREWLLDVFGTESHHSDMSVILISHHLKIGAPAIMCSADAIIMCSMPDHLLRETCRGLGLSMQEIEDTRRTLCDPKGLMPEANKSYHKAFNHVVVWRRPLFAIRRGELIPAPTLFTFQFPTRRRSYLAPIVDT